jgi:hypothetical protein
VFSGCGAPDEKRVREDFAREHPTYLIDSVSSTEGDGSAVYYRIRYKKPNDEEMYEVEWQYMESEGSQWELKHKGEERRVRS